MSARPSRWSRGHAGALRGVVLVAAIVGGGACIKRGYPLGRSGNVEEVAGAIAFVASDDASYITGETLAVSGGLSMW